MLWKNWQYLKNEIYVEDFIDAMMEAGIFTAQNKRDIMMVQPSTRQMKAEKFLNVLIQAGEKGYEMFTTVLHAMRTDNRYTSLMEKLNLPSGNVMVVHPLVEDGKAVSCHYVFPVALKWHRTVYKCIFISNFVQVSFFREKLALDFKQFDMHIDVSIKFKIRI